MPSTMKKHHPVRAAADTTGWPATLVDDEGEPVLTIESDIMVFDRAPCPV